MKTCRMCELEKPRDAFYRDATKALGLRNECKACMKIKRDDPAVAAARRAYMAEYSKRNSVLLVEKARKYYAENREQKITYARQYRIEHAEKVSEYNKQYRENNGSFVKRLQKAWRQANPGYQVEWNRKNIDQVRAGWRNQYYANPIKARANEAKRRAVKLRAIPAWGDMGDINQVYAEARYTGLSVDHIVPLRSKTVCGLHVWENLQLVSKSYNLSKGNRFWPDMPA